MERFLPPSPATRRWRRRNRSARFPKADPPVFSDEEMPMKLAAASACEFDLLALGECMIRLSPPGHQRLEFAPSLELYAGGGEYNVAYALARYGLRTGWISRLAENPLGRFIRNHARASGMDTSEIVWVPYDGAGRKDRVGLNFTEVGTGVRPAVSMY